MMTAPGHRRPVLPRSWMRVLLLALALVMAARPGIAQTADTAEITTRDTVVIGPPAPGPEELSAEGAAFSAWTSLATRAEDALTQGVASDFALARLRTSVVEWRNRFLDEESANSARIETVAAQIAALGPVPEGETPEETRVAARRAELDAQLLKLRAPVILAQEAFAHADGLISELDAALRAGRAEALLVRGASPLDPTIWPVALTALGEQAAALMAEVQTTFSSAARRETLSENVVGVVVLFVLATALLRRGGRWSRRLVRAVDNRGWRGAGVWHLIVSLAQVVLPFVGLLALEASLTQSGMFGTRAMRIIAVIPVAGANVVIARWLAGQFFAPERADVTSLDMDAAKRLRVRGLLNALGVIIAASTLTTAAIGSGDMPESARMVAQLPFGLMLAYVLFWLGREFSAVRAKSGGEEATRRDAVLTIFGRVLTVIAVLGPLLAALGFARASDALIQPAVTTLALLGVVIVLQRLVFDLYGLIIGTRRSGDDALVPVLIGFILVLVALPVLALIWGVRPEELSEIWARFREGYSLGETRISPTDFVTFAVVFGGGYVITRLLQGTLRGSILPRTRLDTGARNAIVAGTGYVGIFLAAIAAITFAGINLSSLAIVAGALSVGIGFGLQNIVSNFVSGIILLIERPISEGDWIEVGGQMGYVRAISVRSTRIETFDRTDVIVPNADLVSGTVTNWTRNNSIGRVKVPVGVAYGTDTEKVAAILQEIAEANPMVLLQPPPNVFFTGFGADSMDFEIRAILRDINFLMIVTSEMNHAIAARFAAEGIEIPFAQRDIWLRNPESLRARTAPEAAITPAPVPPDEADQ